MDGWRRFDLRIEVAFPTFMAICTMNGATLAAVVKDSRSSLPLPNGGFLQLDSGCAVADDSSVEGKQRLVTAAGLPLDPDRTYTVATDFLLLTGLNDNQTLIKYVYPTMKVLAMYLWDFGLNDNQTLSKYVPQRACGSCAPNAQSVAKQPCRRVRPPLHSKC